MASNEEFVAKGIAAGRVLFGLGCMVAPRKILGPAAAKAEGPMIWMARAFGIRDVILGGGTLMALADEGDTSVRWVQMSAMADTLDIASALTFHKELDRQGVIGTLALAVPAAVGGWWAGDKLRKA